MNFTNWFKSIIGDDYIVTEELQYNDRRLKEVVKDGLIIDPNKINVIVKYLGGTVYKQSKIIPVQISMYSPDVIRERDYFTEFAQNYSNMSITDEEYNLTIMNFQTPFVTSNFIEMYNTKRSQILMQGTLIVSDNIDDIKSIEIDEETIETSTRTLAYTILEDSQKESGKYLNETDVQRANLQLSLNGINKNSIFYRKIESIMFGEMDINTTFSVKIIFLQNDRSRDLNMKLSGESINSQDSSLPLRNPILVR